MALFPLGILSAAGAGGAFSSDYELISSTILGTAQSSVVFDVSSFASAYKHLQVRLVSRTNDFNTSVGVNLRFNSDTASNYSSHGLDGEPSFSATPFSSASANSNAITVGIQGVGTYATNLFGATVIDILDPFSTTKNKTTRSLTGNGGLRVGLRSGNWRSTSSVTSVSIIADAGSFIAGSRFSIYGLKG